MPITSNLSVSAEGEQQLDLRQIHRPTTHSMESNALCVLVCIAIRFVNPYVEQKNVLYILHYIEW